MSASSVHRNNPVIEAMGHMAHHTDTLNKTIKTTVQGVKLAGIVASLVPGGKGVATGLRLLGDQLKTTKSVINATNVFGRGYEWGTSKTRNAILSSWQKTAARIALTIAQFFETVLFIDKCALSFFYQASLTVCHLPIFDTVKNCLYMTSAVFGLWYVGQDLSKAISTLHDAKQKKLKWENHSLDSHDKSVLLEKYQTRLDDTGTNSATLSDEIADLQTRIQAEKANLSEMGEEDVKNLRNTIKADELRLTEQKTTLIAVQKLENYLTVINSDNLSSLRDHKIEKYEMRIANSKKIIEKSWISIAVDIGKIVMISLGLFVAAMSVTFPLLAAVEATLVITALSLVTTSLGLTKNLYGKLAPKPESEPVFEAA